MRVLFLGLALVVLGGCGGAPKLVNAPPRNRTICCFGDSLVFGTGATPEESYPAQLARILEQPVGRFGTPGDTTGMALPKCARFAEVECGIIIVTLGGNDILQRVEWAETERNLREIFRQLQQHGAVVAFTGVTGPLNPGRGRVYKEMCAELGVLYIPEIMGGILGNPDLKSDEIHPNAAGYKLIAERVAKALRKAELTTPPAEEPAP